MGIDFIGTKVPLGSGLFLSLETEGTQNDDADQSLPCNLEGKATTKEDLKQRVLMLAQWRACADMTQAELAKMSGVSQSTISKVEHGRLRCAFSVATAKAICRALADKLDTLIQIEQVYEFR